MADVDPVRMLQPAATRVRDPITGRSVWLAGMIDAARVDDDGSLCFDLVVRPEHAPHDRESLVEAVVANLRGVGFTGEVRPRLRVQGGPTARAADPGGDDPIPGMSAGSGPAPHGGPIRKQPIEGVARIVAVASGKGGVGKSTVAANLAVALSRQGHRVGLLDADIHGPSVPTMMDVTLRPAIDDDERIIPPKAFGVKCLSMGMVVDEGTPMVWRGPMVMNAIRQFLQQARWGELDVLLVDLPPGTGDAHLTIIQAVDLAGAVVVTTPQEVAVLDAVRGLKMFDKLGVPLLGVVENMAWYELPDGTRDPVFGEGGGDRAAARFDSRVIGRIPLRSRINRGSDKGLPAALGDDDVAEAFAGVARAVAGPLGLEGGDA